ncbi:MAG: polysaccharide deacetylase family protein [Sciscionella sp.]
MDTDRKGLPPLLMYHSVTPYDEDPLLVTVHPARFQRQMRWLRRAGLRGVSMGELLDAAREGRARGLVGLTFDDGYVDFVTNVVPVLDRLGFGATVFVLAGRLGGDNGWEDRGPRKSLLTEEQVRELAASGIEIGSHGLHHVRLSTVAATTLRDEVSDSRSILREITGQEVAGFCYPYGDLSGTAVDAVRAAGYDYACAVSRTNLAGRYALPRVYVGDRDNAVRLAVKWLRYRITRRADSGTSWEVGEDLGRPRE